jgi:hypothetical protein
VFQKKEGKKALQKILKQKRSDQCRHMFRFKTAQVSSDTQRFLNLEAMKA